MATFTKKKLSGSTDGLAIKVTGTGTGSTVTVHTAVASTTAGVFDEVWLYANNTSASAVKLTLEWGTDTAADGNIELTIAAESGLVLVIPGLILQNGMVVEAFAATADVILLTGYVNAITA
jgi:uncharacterized membrane protein YjjP (DUF1212 family)